MWDFDDKVERGDERGVLLIGREVREEGSAEFGSISASSGGEDVFL